MKKKKKKKEEEEEEEKNGIMRSPYHPRNDKKRTIEGFPSQVFHGNSDTYMNPFLKRSLHDGLIQPILPPQQTWCQSYLNKPRNLDLGRNRDDINTVWKHSLLCQDPTNIQCGEGMGNGAPMFGSHMDGILTQISAGGDVGASLPGTARPRVRARRGQATDPHSIAERLLCVYLQLRRERIAERMKALQEMVPSANKSDKAAMLDEIIEYVKFLQLQVKVLSMSRLSGAGVMVPLVSDLHIDTLRNIKDLNPCEDGISLAEGQVARLMEEDMSSAMAFLQAKGLCLMPIALANAMSRKTVRPMVGHCNELQGFSTIDHSMLNGPSSSWNCCVGEGDSTLRGEGQQEWS